MQKTTQTLVHAPRAVRRHLTKKDTDRPVSELENRPATTEMLQIHVFRIGSMISAVYGQGVGFGA